MATVGVVNVKFSAQTSEYSKGVAKAKQENKGFVDNLKSTLGEDSAIGKQLKILQGAGAVAGLTIAANALSNITAKALELKNQFKAGAISAGDVADGLLRSLPVLGAMYSASRNLRELATGEIAAEEKALKIAQERLAVIEGQRKAIGEARKAIEDSATAQRKHNEEMEVARASAEDAPFVKIAQDTTREMDEIRKKWDDIIARSNPSMKNTLWDKRNDELFGASLRGYEREQIVAEQQTIARMKQRRADEQEMANAAIAEAKAVADAVRTPGEVAAAEFERLQSLFDRGLITKDVFDKSKVEAYNRAFGNTVETAEQFADRMAQIRQSNQDTFTKYAKFAQGEVIPQPTVTERRGTFLTPSRTDPQSELKAAVTDGLNKVKDKITELTTAITQNPQGILMSIFGGKK